MKKSDTQIRVYEQSADFLAKIRTEFGLASVGVVVDRMIELYGEDFRARMLAAHGDS